jgi:uncharacterized protein YerC
MPSKLSESQRINVVSLIQKGESTINIVKRTGVSKATVNRIKAEVDPDYIRSTAGRP